MYLISAERYKNAEVDAKIVRKTGEIWVSMKEVGGGLGVKNICNLVLKEKRGALERKNPTKEQINEYKMTEREIYETFGNLSEDQLNTKSNKIVCVRNDVMAIVIKHYKGEKKEVKEE